ncbi:hypothetical protein SAMN06265365_101340 [Tistlia consotensis]|uniref:CopC domain-containing protein n=1 Tax=Tistlia consotensis USBA 355 TaxID=560819 RepID=A0A1Y6B516_9PROT|nr:copper homeostasis periplasmic binding protein CopC [Tistlia consotensis]SME90738.1 hypothetical protein SAMN05428998_101338 [Tistlia consotensis USBA 355]SNR26914.1 hypothetical protein SAMN06265365_101340 [Tistlia consotensis]
MTLVRTFLLSALILFGGVGTAFAHAHLLSSVPADRSVVAASPSELTLTFSEGLEIALSGVTLTTAGKQVLPTGKPQLAKDSDKVMVVPVESPLAAGRYRVEWHALSRDGHSSHGAYAFTVRP